MIHLHFLRQFLPNFSFLMVVLLIILTPAISQAQSNYESTPSATNKTSAQSVEIRSGQAANSSEKSQEREAQVTKPESVALSQPNPAMLQNEDLTMLDFTSLLALVLILLLVATATALFRLKNTASK